MRSLPAMLVAPVAVLLAAGCLGTTGSSDTGRHSTGVGPITMASVADFTGYLQPLINRWNSDHPAERVSLLEVAEGADEQRAQMVTNLQAKTDRYDVLALDVVWTAEFADAGWIVPLDRRQFPLHQFLKPAVDTAMFRDALYAIPYTSNAGLLYYRSDVLRKHRVRPPRTWAELKKAASDLAGKEGMQGYAGQFLPYEGLAVNFFEVVQSAGGSILTGDGTNVAVDSAPARAGLSMLVDGFREGWIPHESLGYKEEESRRAFQRGRLLFLRNWPYAYRFFARPGPDNHVKGKFGVLPVPGLGDAPGSSSLGGGNLAISAFSRHQTTALRFIKYLTSPASQREILVQGSYPPVLTFLYDDAGLRRRFPYLPVLKQSILSAHPRPKSPDYNQVTLIIYSGAYSALTLRKPVDQTLAQMSRDLNAAIANR